MKKRIIKLYAYLEKNLGDDLMVECLCNRYPQYKFYYCDMWKGVDSLEHCSNFFHKEDVYERWGRINHLLNIITLYKKKNLLYDLIFRMIEKRSCCSIYIGGSLFIEGEMSNLERRMELEEKRLNVAPLFIIGSNFGPYTSIEFLEKYKNFFGKCEGVTFRDHKSTFLFRELKNINYAPDVVLNIEGKKHTHTPRVLVSVIDLSNRKQLVNKKEEYEAYIVKLCKEIIKQGKIPVLMSFCEKEGDEKAVQAIFSQLNEKEKNKVECLYYTNNVQEMLAYYQKAEYVVATRFHAMILAMKYRIPFFAFAYDYKVKNVLEDLNCDYYCDISEITQTSFSKVLDWERKPLDITEYEKKATNQFWQLEQFLNSNI